MSPRDVLIITSTAQVCNALEQLNKILDGSKLFPSLVEAGEDYTTWLCRLKQALADCPQADKNRLAVIASGIHPEVLWGGAGRTKEEEAARVEAFISSGGFEAEQKALDTARTPR